MATTTDLVKTGEDSTFLALRMPHAELIGMVRENLGGEGLSPSDLDRVKVPAGGGKTWEVPTFEGEVSTGVIEGVVIDRATRRAYWPDAYSGASDPPQCYSNDGLSGVGEPGGDCSSCPFNQYESAENGVGKACKETRQMFVLTPDSLIPLIITVPPASLKNVRSYFMRLLSAQISPLGVVTKIGLEQAKSTTGILYSKVTLTAGDRLDADAEARMREYAKILQPAFAAADAAAIQQDEV